MEKRTLFMPILKSSSGEFFGILSDTSIDRDEEKMSKSLLVEWAEKSKKIPALLNHENKVESNIAVWENPQIIRRKGHTALKMTPRFFKSNPKSQMVKGMLEEGALLGVSIGAIPHDFKEVEVDGKMILEWTKAELLEASFTPVPSNRNGQAVFVAKSLDLAKKFEEEIKNNILGNNGGKMEAHKKEMEKLNTELVKKNDELEALNKEVAELKKAAELEKADSKKVSEEGTKNLEAVQGEIAKLKEEMVSNKAKMDEELEKKIREHGVILKGHDEKVAELEKLKLAAVADKPGELNTKDYLTTMSK